MAVAETVHFEPLSIAIGPAVCPGEQAKNTNSCSHMIRKTGYSSHPCP